jgi:hypothetical protein
MGERRVHTRIRSLNFVAVEGLLFRTLDVSREGLMLEMATPPPVGAKLQLTIAFGETMVKVPAEVMRHEQRGKKWIGVGLKFGELNSKARVALEQHLIAMKMQEAGKA